MPAKKKVEDEKFIKFISNTRECRAKEIINEFKNELSEKQIYQRLKDLKEKGCIFHFKEQSPYYSINYDFFFKSMAQEIKSDYDETISLVESYRKFKDRINKNIEIYYDEEKFPFSDRMLDIFYGMVTSFLIICFFNNPDFWDSFKNERDLDFPIIIKTHWSKDDRIFNFLEKHKKRCFSDNYLYQVDFFSEISKSILEINERKNIIFPTYDEKRLNDLAVGQFQRRKRRKQSYHKKKEKLKNSYLELINYAIEDLKNHPNNVQDSTNYLEKLEDYKKDIEKEYITFKDAKEGYDLIFNKYGFPEIKPSEDVKKFD